MVYGGIMVQWGIYVVTWHNGTTSNVKDAPHSPMLDQLYGTVNALPEDLRSTECMNTFKVHLKTLYFKIAFNV